MVSALLANAVFAAFEELEQRLKSCCILLDAETLRKKLQRTEPDLKGPSADGDTVEAPLIVFTERLCRISNQLRKMKANSQTNKSGAITHVPRLALKTVLSCATKAIPTDSETLSVMLQSIGHHIQCTCQCARIIRTSTPVLAEVGYFLTHDQVASNDLRCSYGLRLLLEAHGSLLRTSKTATQPLNCRLTALKFAQEAMTSIRAVLDDSTMPCRCHGTLAYHLENLHGDLQAYLQTKGFDIYLQSPWVAGAHILDILEALFYYGLRLFSYRHYAGAVVHVYNVLTSLTGMTPIPLLESVCCTLGDIIFPGGRPSRNFKNCYLRYMGGRLRFNGQRSSHRSGCHSMAIPAHTAKATAGFGSRGEVKDPRFDCHKVSFFHSIKAKNYQLDDAAWKYAHNVGNSQNQPCSSTRKAWRPCSHQAQSEDKYSHWSPQDRFGCLRRAVLSEFQGLFPVARIDLCKVYLALVHTVDLISDRFHGDGARPGQKCLCFTDAILSAADRCGNGEHPIQSSVCEGLVEICQVAMTEILRPCKPEEFLWRNA